jgi:hypothetical protein
MALPWAQVEALLGGTNAMRIVGAKLLPKWPNEEPESYRTRLETATLFPALRRTVSVMTGKPFSKEMRLSPEVPTPIVEYCEDVDLEGRSLHVFLSDVFDEVLAYGICGVLVDYPMTEGKVKTLADQKAMNARPYFVFIKHDQILGWQTAKQNGVTMLTQLRLAEVYQKPDGPYGFTEVKRVRVLTPGAWELWEEQKKDEYALVASGPTTIKTIPFVPFYGLRQGFMSGTSPLSDVAYLNTKHWQKQSDVDTTGHIVCVPILAIIGADDNSGLTVGGASAVKLPVGGDMKYIEHSGAGADFALKLIEGIEGQMIQAGAELLIPKAGVVKTATQSNQDAEGNKSDLQRIVETFEDSIDQALQLMADWMGLPDGGNVEMFKDFSAGSLSDASAQLILSLQQGGLITKATVLQEMQRRSILGADMNPEDELAEVETEGPSLGIMGIPANGDVAEPASESANAGVVNGAPAIG